MGDASAQHFLAIAVMSGCQPALLSGPSPYILPPTSPSPQVTVRVKSNFGPKLWAGNVVILIPVPDQTARATFSLSTGGCALFVKALFGCTGGGLGHSMQAVRATFSLWVCCLRFHGQPAGPCILQDTVPRACWPRSASADGRHPSCKAGLL